MRCLLACVFVLAVAATASAKTPFQRQCLVPSPWSMLRNCIDRTEPGAKIIEWQPDLRVVYTSSGYYLFFARDNLWRAVYGLADTHYELVSIARPDAAKPNVRIELSHIDEMRHQRMLRLERVVVICDPRHACHARVTACTLMRVGRAVETYRGTFDLDGAGDPVVTGDRSHAGSSCGSR